jgi:hypothetical protein
MQGPARPLLYMSLVLILYICWRMLTYADVCCRYWPCIDASIYIRLLLCVCLVLILLYTTTTTIYIYIYTYTYTYIYIYIYIYILILLYVIIYYYIGAFCYTLGPTCLLPPSTSPTVYTSLFYKYLLYIYTLYVVCVCVCACVCVCVCVCVYWVHSGGWAAVSVRYARMLTYADVC